MTEPTPDIRERKYIESVPDRCGGEPCIVGSRIRVQDIVLWTEAGKSADDIVEEFPQLSLAAVHAALAYYFDHQAEIDAQIAGDEQFVEKMKLAYGSGPLSRIE